MTTVQSDLKYTKEHEWVLVEDSIATIGISDHAQQELGDITFVELPDEGMELHVGDEAANIESVKAASPVFSAVSGTVTEVNADLEDSPESVNHDPYDSGWIFRVEMSAPGELDALMNAEQYEAFLSEAEENA